MAPDDLNRRTFLAAAAGAAATYAASARATPARSANGRLRLGFIGAGGRANTHINNACKLFTEEGAVEVAAVCDVFSRYREDTAAKVEKLTGYKPMTTGDYRDIVGDASIDAVLISTPDHWHAKQTIDSLAAGKHVYCEKPMTHTVQEAIDVYHAWRSSGLVMQVGVQSTSLPVWGAINERVRAGDLGKILQFQTEFFRNSDMGQWRYYRLAEDMTPSNINWPMFLGTDFGLAPGMPFDRAKFAQWRRFWAFGSGMFTDLFVHRTTSMLKATGLRFPSRVVGAGGIFLEYDGREVPDVATVVADFDEGVQGLITATMCCSNTPIKQTIRGHFGSMVPVGPSGVGVGEEFSGYQFVAERPQVTHDSSIVDERVHVAEVSDTSKAHLKNFVSAARDSAPDAVNCSPELGAAAMAVVKLGTKSYREGTVCRFDASSLAISTCDGSWSSQWEATSAERGKPNHVPGWSGGDKGSVLTPRDYQRLEGPWINGVDPARA